MKVVWDYLKVDWEESYGQKEQELPIPSTILVGRDGVVREVFVEANYHQRMEPGEALGWLEKHKESL
jgi:peroxiredoxin